MYIKTITMEGFKSYGTRTEITGFDPLFNAITGLNGSGKSNILDSICFVLGITNLTHVRATNLNELVYKNGQAGINKATVTIKFDNRDTASSPLGYASSPEITVTRTVVTGGKNKYLINGVSANNNRVHDLFQSVQMNVNNPHFLIMQGRITKVLNMKPLEILSMIEEAAGTRMYEDKKESALKNLDKKDSRLREINNMLTEHICPQMQKLKEERKEYIEYSRISREHETLSKLYIAWDFLRTEELVNKSGGEKEKLERDFNEHKAIVEDIKKEIKEADKRIADIEKTMDEEGGNKLRTLEEELKKVQVTETRADTQFRNLKEALNEEKKKNAEITKNIRDEKCTLAQKEKELVNSVKKLEDLKIIADKDNDAITAAENRFHAVNAGVSDSQGEEASLAAQLISAGKDRKDAETEAKSLEMTIKHIKAELEKKKMENKKVDKSYTQDQTLYQKLDGEVKRLRADINKLSYEDGKYEDLQSQERKLNMEIDRLQDELDSVFARFPQLSFDYVDPVKNFDRKKVYGPVCLQIKLKNPKDAVALDVTAGGRLYNVIVDDEKTGKMLLDKGQLKRRATVIPLNKIVSNPIGNKMLQDAEDLVGKQNVAVAMSHVDYDKTISPAIEFVFGSSFICTESQFAKTVAFANNIKRRCVTLDGSVFEPFGTLSGGSTGNKGKMLAELVPLAGIKSSLSEKQHKLQSLQKEIQNVRIIKERYNALNEQYELKENEAQLLKSKIEQSNYHKQIEEFQKLEQSLEDQKSLMCLCKEKQKNAEKIIKELELKTSKSNRENKVKEAEKAVSDCKKKAAASLEKYNNFQAEVNGIKMEIEGIMEGLPMYEEQLEANSKCIQEDEKKLQEAEEERKKIKESLSTITEEVKAQKAIMKSHSGEINKISKEKDVMTKKIANAELQMQQLEHDIKNCGDHTVEASRKLKHLLEKYKWIESERKFFGVTQSAYDFKSFNPKAAPAQLKELEELKSKLHMNVNERAQSMLETVEQQFKNLIKKKDVVLNDKAVIENVIRELDEQKKIALRKACEQVNKDFGSIFRTLLPGSSARLINQPGKSVLDGLEFKVAFGGVWKDSLNELSGGQRSLVALSLILALLLFNPAPIYILDEVDAALDLSHTQNIGKMLRMHFQKSQFIIVSLKDGMFSNANVLFQTKFSDGMSSVTRTCQRRR